MDLRGLQDFLPVVAYAWSPAYACPLANLGVQQDRPSEVAGAWPPGDLGGLWGCPPVEVVVVVVVVKG